MVRAIIDSMARYTVNDAAVARARRLIEARHYVLTSDWGEVVTFGVEPFGDLAGLPLNAPVVAISG